MLIGSYATNPLETAQLLAPDFKLDAFTTFDLHAEIRSNDNRWIFTVFCRNVTDEYYETGAFDNNATLSAYNGAPATYGATIALRY